MAYAICTEAPNSVEPSRLRHKIRFRHRRPSDTKDKQNKKITASDGGLPSSKTACTGKKLNQNKY